MASGRTLIDQKSKTLRKAGISHAVLMSDHDDKYYHSAVLVASKDTYAARALHANRISKEHRDLWIIDEGHRSLGPEWMQILPQDDSTIVVMFTATPALTNGKGMGGYCKGMVKAATYSELIDAKLLVPCRVFAPWSIDTTGLKTGSEGDWSWKAAEKRFNQKVITGNIVETWKKLGGGKPTVCFSQGVKHSLGLRDEFNSSGIPAAHVDADTPDDERKEIFRQLRDGYLKVVTNFGVLTTGWDEPCVQCGILAFATDSLVKYLQVAGRVLRPFPGKEEALIIDHGDNVRRHGWPTADHDWSLDPDEKIQEREFKAREKKGEREPICCPKCGAMRESGPKCINCGHQHHKTGAKIINQDGELIEIKASKVKKQSSADALQKTWMSCLAIAAHKGSNFYAAKMIFASRTKKPADGMSPMPEKHQMMMPVGAVYPGFIRRGKAKS